MTQRFERLASAWNSSMLTWLFAVVYLAYLGRGAWVSYQKAYDPKDTSPVILNVAWTQIDEVKVHGQARRVPLREHKKNGTLVGPSEIAISTRRARPAGLKFRLMPAAMTAQDTVEFVNEVSGHKLIVQDLERAMIDIELPLASIPCRVKVNTAAGATYRLIDMRLLSARDTAKEPTVNPLDGASATVTGAKIYLGSGWWPRANESLPVGADEELFTRRVAHLRFETQTPGRYRIRLPYRLCCRTYADPLFFWNGEPVEAKLEPSQEPASVRSTAILEVDIATVGTLTMQFSGRLLSPRQHSKLNDDRPLAYGVCVGRVELSAPL